jgi:diguanylate cyclase (GGDEF)-like protein/PAS domain S-box-containing protein
MNGAVSSTGVLGWVRDWVSRSHEPAKGDASRAMSLEHLPISASVFVIAVVAVGCVVVILQGPRQITHPTQFVALLAASVLASSLRLRLPLGTSASNLSISYSVDFAALLLIGREMTMLVAGASACAQSIFGTNRRNPAFRILFNAAALVLTVQAAGVTFAYFGGEPGEVDLTSIAKPLVASALAYYIVNTAIVATAVGLAARQPVWQVWQTNFLWTAPSYFVGAGAAVAGVALWETSQWWLLPLAAAPVYLTFRSYRMYVDRIASEKRHKEEVLRLHGDTVAALEAARRSEQRYALAAAGSNDGLWDWDIPANSLYCSDRWKLIVGLEASDEVSTHEQWLNYAHEEDRPGLMEALRAHLDGERAHFEHEYRVRQVRGELRWVSCRGIAVRDDAGRPVRMAGSLTDITEQRRVRDSLSQAARHDPLTNLPNRTLFGELLQRAIAQGARSPQPQYAVLFIDLDGFKLVNDSLGHIIGDRFLVAIAQRLQSQLRPGDSLARLGGDEFAVLAENFSSPEDVCAIAERLLNALAEPFRIADHELFGSASVGVVIGGAQYRTVDAVLRDADIAMYRAKSSGRGGYELFDPDMHATALKRLTLETELRRAVERKEFSIFYQPIVELATTRIIGLEALLRWKRADGHIDSPAEFIAIAEETGLIIPLTSHVLVEGCYQVAAWQKLFGQSLQLSVNVPSKLFMRANFVDEVETVMTSSGLMPNSLQLEITESVLLTHSDVVDRNFQRLHEIGVAVHLDDFGTGYSSLSYLQRYPVDALKLDRTFVARMGTHENDVVGGAIVKLARELGMGIIAEGVETVEHAEQLSALDCPHAQGFLFSEPLTASAVAPMLAKQFTPTLANVS